MEEAVFSKVLGLGLTPSIKGMPSTSAFVPGKLGKAFRAKFPTYLSYGNQRNRCLGNIERCNYGITIVLWVCKYERRERYFLSSGGQDKKSFGGLALSYNNPPSMGCRITTSTTVWSITTHEKLQVGRWYYVGITWSQADGLTFFLNGKPVVKDKTGSLNKTTINKHNNFDIGRTNGVLDIHRDSIYYADGLVDELIIWERLLQPIM